MTSCDSHRAPTPSDFSSVLVHGLVLHILGSLNLPSIDRLQRFTRLSAFLVTIIATVPLFVNIWRRYAQNNPQVKAFIEITGDKLTGRQVDAGWFQNGTILVASALCLVGVRTF